MAEGEPSNRLALSTVLLKISGEGLGEEDASGQRRGVSPQRLKNLVTEIDKVVRSGARVGIVLGAGNFVRGAELAAAGLDRAACDAVGMLATVMNGMLLEEALSAAGIPATHLAAPGIVAGVPAASASSARSALAAGRVAVLSGGTGNPFFTTDSAGALRAREIGAQALIKATKVDGVYDDDPAINPDARRLDRIDYDEVMTRNLKVMDLTAVTLCKEGGIPILVCDLFVPDNLVRLVRGESVGTRIG